MSGRRPANERALASSHGMLHFFCSFSLFNYLLCSYNDDDDYDGRGWLLPLPPLFPSPPSLSPSPAPFDDDNAATTTTRLQDNDNNETARQRRQWRDCET